MSGASLLLYGALAAGLGLPCSVLWTFFVLQVPFRERETETLQARLLLLTATPGLAVLLALTRMLPPTYADSVSSSLLPQDDLVYELFGRSRK